MKDEIRAGELTMRAGGAGAVRMRVVTAEKAALVPAEEQLAYARWLDLGMKLGLLLLAATFAVYAMGVLAPHTAVADLPSYWSLPVKQYLAATGIHAGWGWIFMLHKGDFLNFVGIAFLSSVTMGCYAAIIPIFLRKKERIYAWLAVTEVLVLALAASGLLKGGGH